MSGRGKLRDGGDKNKREGENENNEEQEPRSLYKCRSRLEYDKYVRRAHKRHQSDPGVHGEAARLSHTHTGVRRCGEHGITVHVHRGTPNTLKWRVPNCPRQHERDRLPWLSGQE